MKQPATFLSFFGVPRCISKKPENLKIIFGLKIEKKQPPFFLEFLAKKLLLFFFLVFTIENHCGILKVIKNFGDCFRIWWNASKS